MYGTVSFMGQRAVGAAASRFAAMAKLGCPVEAVVGRGAGRETAICQAILELLNETGYEAVTMDAVAARAKASKATIYRRWSNKESLLLDALRRVFASRQDVLPDTGSLRGDLLAMISAQTQDPVLVATNTAALKGLVYASSTEPELAAAIRSTLEDAHLHTWGLLLSRAHVRGELAVAVPPALAWEVAQGQFCARTGVENGQLDQRYVQHIVDDILLPVISHAGRLSEVLIR